MKLIIAEKPSLGRNIASAIGINSFKNNDGYLESNEYIVTWGFGHLFSLKDIEEYKPKDVREDKPKWTLEGLPFKPQNFEFALKKSPKGNSVDAGVRKQFNTIKSLCSRPDVTAVINAGDADREGEIIIRIILDAANNKKPVMRLWLPEQTPATIRSALKDLTNDNKYNNLADEGYARTYIDWLYGVNLTRLASLKSNKLLRVGRVIVPTVKAIYDRDMEIRNFKSEKYWAIISNAENKGIKLELQSKNKFTYKELDKALALCKLYNNTGAVVTDKTVSEKTIASGKLFSLSTLQAVLGKKYKMSPKESLSIIQELYEAGYVTYPRTNSEYLAVAEQRKINHIISLLSDKGFKVEPKDKSKAIYDDSKIESHSALTPTYKLAGEADLNEKQWKVYSTILDRFLAVFCSVPCKVNRTTLSIAIGEHENFKINGDIILQKGWMMYEESSKKDKILPDLNRGDKVIIAFKPVEKETQPPKHYTVETLGNYMKNPFKKVKGTVDPDNQTEDSAESDIEEYKAMFEGVELGTEATRTGIIENAIRSGYISLKNNIYTILPAGEYYIETLQALGLCLTKEKTAEMGKSLKKVYKGEITVQQSVDYTFSEIKNLFNCADTVKVKEATPIDNNQKEVGKCPKCGSAVVENKYGFYCSDYKNCKFGIGFNNKFITEVLNKNVTATMIKSLLAKKQASVKGCTSKAGKKYDCILHADFSGQYPQFNISFDNKKGK